MKKRREKVKKKKGEKKKKNKPWEFRMQSLETLQLEFQLHAYFYVMRSVFMQKFERK